MRYTVFDTNAIDAEEVERLRRDMNETSFAREYLCDFTRPATTSSSARLTPRRRAPHAAPGRHQATRRASWALIRRALATTAA